MGKPNVPITGELLEYFKQVRYGKKAKAVWREATQAGYLISYSTFLRKYYLWEHQSLTWEVIEQFSKRIKKLENKVKNLEDRLNAWARRRKQGPKLKDIVEDLEMLDSLVKKIYQDMDKKVDEKVNEQFQKEVQKAIHTLKQATIPLLIDQIRSLKSK